MIKYQLICDAEHEFEGWFRDSADYDAQAGEGLIECPSCGSSDIRKAVMAPSIARRSNARDARLSAINSDIANAVRRARDYVEKNFDYVGEKFPEEARKIHYGEKEDRGIYGEASGKDVRALIDEGIQIAPMPGTRKKTDEVGVPKMTPIPDKKLN